MLRTYNLTSVIFTLYLISNSQLYSQSCPVYSLPFFENFNGPAFQLPATGPFPDAGQLDSCWSRSSTTGYVFEPGTGPVKYLNSGPRGGHPAGVGKYLFSGLVAGSSATTSVSTPAIDLSTVTDPQLRFWYHMYGSDIDSVNVEVQSQNSWSLIHTWHGQQHSSSKQAWSEAVFSLNAFNNDTVKIRITAARKNIGNVGVVVAIDDFWVGDSAACQAPTNLSVDRRTPASVDLSWNTGGASQWQLSYGLAGTPAGGGTLQASSASNSRIQGLAPNTDYWIYVRDSCGPGDLSRWHGPIEAHTRCSVTSAPFVENFDGSSFIVPARTWHAGTTSPCWERDDTTDFYFKVFSGSTFAAYSGPNADHTSGNGKYLYSAHGTWSNNKRTAELYSPLIDLGNLSMPQLRFFHHMYGYGIDQLKVEARASGSWQVLNTIKGEQQNSKSAPWEEVIVSLAPFKNDTVEIRISAKRLGSQPSDIAIDDFEIRNAPNCPASSKMTAVPLSAHSIELDWLSGGANQWQLAYREVGNPNFTLVNVSAKPFILNGLSNNTTYVFKVRDSCAVGDTGPWSKNDTATTPCGFFQAPFYENFDGPQWVTGNNNFNNNNNKISGCWSRPAAGNPHFGTWSGPTGTTNTGPSGDFSGNGKYIVTEVSDGSGIGKISTPYIIVPDTIYKPHLSFAYHTYGADIVALRVKIDSGNGFEPNYILLGEQQTSSSDPWKMDSIDLAAYANDTVRFQFFGSSTGFYGDVAVDEVKVSKNCPAVTAAFTDSTNFLQVSFSSSSQRIDSLLWDFGDGKTDTATNPVHQYDSAGTYVARLIAFNLCGKSDTILDTLQLCDSLSAHISARVQGDTVYFSADSSWGASGYVWNLDDSLSSTVANPVAIYDSTGVKNIRLTLYNSCGDSLSTSRSIKICPAPVASWTYDTIGKTSSGLEIHFDATASKNASLYHWDFGDGTTGTGPAPKHTYNPAGLFYEVELTVTNECGTSGRKAFHLYEVDLPELTLRKSFKLYPNPAEVEVFLKWNPEDVKLQGVSLYNSAGQKLQSHVVEESGRFRMGIHELPRGYYVLRLTTSNGNANLKLIKH